MTNIKKGDIVMFNKVPITNITMGKHYKVYRVVTPDWTHVTFVRVINDCGVCVHHAVNRATLTSNNIKLYKRILL